MVIPGLASALVKARRVKVIFGAGHEFAAGHWVTRLRGRVRTGDSIRWAVGVHGVEVGEDAGVAAAVVVVKERARSVRAAWVVNVGVVACRRATGAPFRPPFLVQTQRTTSFSRYLRCQRPCAAGWQAVEQGWDGPAGGSRRRIRISEGCGEA